MAITVWLSNNLSRIAKGTEGFDVDGETVGECINEIVSLVPAMRNALFSASRLNGNIEIQVNRENVVAEECLTKKVTDGDEVRIMLKTY